MGAIGSSVILEGWASSVFSSPVLGEPVKSDVLGGPELCGCIDPKVAEGGGVISNSPSTEGSRCVSIDPAKEITMGRILPAIVGVVLMDRLLHS